VLFLRVEILIFAFFVFQGLKILIFRVKCAFFGIGNADFCVKIAFLLEVADFCVKFAFLKPKLLIFVKFAFF
jgi:hypothetical protein